MNARLLSTNGPALLDRALQSHLRLLQHAAADYDAMRHPIEPNRMITRVSRCLSQPGKLPPATPENGTGNVSREHVKHKYKRPRCRIQKNDRKLYNLFW